LAVTESWRGRKRGARCGPSSWAERGRRSGNGPCAELPGLVSREGKELDWARREGGGVTGQTRERALGHAGVEGNGPWDRAVSEGAG